MFQEGSYLGDNDPSANQGQGPGQCLSEDHIISRQFTNGQGQGQGQGQKLETRAYEKKASDMFIDEDLSIPYRSFEPTEDAPDLDALEAAEQQVNAKGTEQDLEPIKGSTDSFSITNFDQFLVNLYQYHVAHGFWPFILQHLTRLITSTSVFMMSFFFSLCVHWDRLYECAGNHSQCFNLFSWFASINAFWIMFNLGHLIYWSVVFWKGLRAIFSAKNLYHFCKNSLQIDDHEMPWQEIVQSMIKAIDQGRLQVIKREVSQAIVCSILLRQDNILSGLFRHNVLDLNLFNKQWDHILFSQPLVFILQQFVIQKVCTERIYRREVVQDRLRSAFCLVIFFLPFILVFHVSISIFKQIQHIGHRNSQGMAFYKWTDYAEIALRHHDEYQHDFQARLYKYREAIETSFKVFPNRALFEIVKQIVFVCSTMVGLMLLCTLINSSTAFNVVILGYPIFVWLSLLTPIIVVCRSYLTQDVTVSVKEKKQAIALIYSKDRDRSFVQESDEQVLNQEIRRIRDRYQNLYVHKILIFFSEVLGILFLPKLVWMLGSDKHAMKMVEFFNQHLAIYKHDPNVGLVYVENYTPRGPTSPLLKPLDGYLCGVSVHVNHQI